MMVRPTNEKVMEKIFKNGQMYTPEQEEKISKLAELKFWDVLKIYKKHCREGNWTNEHRAKVMRGNWKGCSKRNF
jgi:hypothetical protein